MTEKKKAYLRLKKIIDSMLILTDDIKDMPQEDLEWIANRLMKKGYKEKLDSIPSNPFNM